MLSHAGPGELVAEGNLFDFFRSRVQKAVTHQRAPVSEAAVWYISGVLADQGHRDEEPVPATLVELRARAQEAPMGEAVSLWKRLGDHSLVVIGFFRESLERRKISPSYCSDMGRSAYGSLARMLRDPSGAVVDVFGELAERFEACAGVIQEVREESRECNATDIVRLYEEWLATGSPRVAERLRQLGVVPVRTGGVG